MSPRKRITRVSAILALIGAAAITAGFVMGMTGWPPAMASASWAEAFAGAEDVPATLSPLEGESSARTVVPEVPSVAENAAPAAATLAVPHSKATTPKALPAFAFRGKGEGKQRKAEPAKRASRRGWRSARVSWYGPGFYGNTMAGGGKLRRSSMVVAHRSLPFGTKVQFKFRGRTVTATVRDRGPYVSGRTFDLGPGTAKRLGFRGVGTIKYQIVKR